MIKKILLGVLVFTVVGAGAAAAAYGVISNDPAPVADAVDQVSTIDPADLAATQQQVAQNQQAGPVAEGLVGEPFAFQAQVMAMDANGINVQMDSGESLYVELGPQDYWQGLDAKIALGDRVAIEGSVNEDMYHATTLTTADNQTMVLRSETGQPMWSGGVTNGQNGNGSTDGTHTPDPQAVVDEWITLSGTIVSILNGKMTIEMADGTQVTFQTGQPRFLAAQGVVFNLGDAVEVVGFYSDVDFVAGDITQLSTGDRVMLRDPNGRPLWAGPGNGNGNGAEQGATN